MLCSFHGGYLLWSVLEFPIGLPDIQGTGRLGDFGVDTMLSHLNRKDGDPKRKCILRASCRENLSKIQVVGYHDQSIMLMFHRTWLFFSFFLHLSFVEFFLEVWCASKFGRSHSSYGTQADDDHLASTFNATCSKHLGACRQDYHDDGTTGTDAYYQVPGAGEVGWVVIYPDLVMIFVKSWGVHMGATLQHVT